MSANAQGGTVLKICGVERCFTLFTCGRDQGVEASGLFLCVCVCMCVCFKFWRSSFFGVVPSAGFFDDSALYLAFSFYLPGAEDKVFASRTPHNHQHTSL